MISYTIQKLSSLFVLALFVAGVVALSPMRATAQDDPPGRVARLNYIQGSVAYQVSGDQDWVQADPNRPLTAGDNLWVDKNSRGEVHIGSTAIRMSSETGISFLTLDDNTVQLQLAQGAIEVHVRDVSSDNALEIDTPNLAFTIDRGGEYRIQTDPNGGSSIDHRPRRARAKLPVAEIPGICATGNNTHSTAPTSFPMTPPGSGL